MIFKLHVVSRADYDAHLTELKTAGETGAPTGAKEAETIAGLREEGNGNAEDVQEGPGH
jgi:cytochrome c oxidase subunit 2